MMIAATATPVPEMRGVSTTPAGAAAWSMISPPVKSALVSGHRDDELDLMVEVVGERRIGDGRSIANNGIRRLLEENGGSPWSPFFISLIFSTPLRPHPPLPPAAQRGFPPTPTPAIA